jgi:CHASE1-domain containing sensor protein
LSLPISIIRPIKRDEARFRQDVLTTEQVIVGERLRSYIALLEATAGYFTAEENNVTREEFQRFTNRLELDEQYPGVQAIGFYSTDSPRAERLELNEVLKSSNRRF